MLPTGAISTVWLQQTLGNDTSAAATLYRGTAPTVVTQPVAFDTICSGTSTTINFGINMLSIDTTYLWQYYNGVTWTNVSDGTPTGFSYVYDISSPSLQINTTAATPYGTYRFRSRVLGGCGNLNSDTSKITVRNAGQWLGYTNAWETTTNWGCGTLPGISTNVVIPTTPEGGNQPVVNSTGTALANDLFMFTGSSVTVNATQDLTLAGNITNNGTASFGAGIVQLQGSVKQTIGGTTSSVFGNLYVDNSVSGVALELNQDMDVNTNLNMLNLNGSLDLNGYDIDLGTTGEILNESNANRIYDVDNDGGRVLATRTLSSGTAYSKANLGGLGLDLDIKASSASPGLTQFVRRHESMITTSGTSVQRTYEIHAAVGTGLNLKMGIWYFDAEMTGAPSSEADLIPWRLPDGEAENDETKWEGQFYPSRITRSVASTNNWVKLDSVSSFSTWTLSDWLVEPLPVELLSFTATADHHNMEVDLNWQTASETNNAYFTVQRSRNAVDFEDVLSRDGAGNSTTVRTYDDVDVMPYMGVSYYRLKQTDFNGSFTYSEVVPVTFKGEPVVHATSWVNQDRNIQVLINDRGRSSYTLKVFDAAGKLVISEQVNTGKGSNHHLVYNPGLAPGVYLLRLEGSNQTYTGKLFIR